MSHQALLFCSDPKTTQVVSQLLRELEFATDPCTEPFTTVKLLMEQHFDAIVVDCDNEQNAALLFKGARNSSLNHSSLTVAIVEGQAGIAKAFRMGANLVLTKPINIDQAKGTLRVARGLMRKAESKVPSGRLPHSAPAAAATHTSNPMAEVAMSRQDPAGSVPLEAAVEAQNSAPLMSFELEKELTRRTDAAERAVLDSMPAPLLPTVDAESSLLSNAWQADEPEPSFGGYSGPHGAAAAAAPARVKEPAVIENPIHVLESISAPEATPAREAHNHGAQSHTAPSPDGHGSDLRGWDIDRKLSAKQDVAGTGSGKKFVVAAIVLLAIAGGYFGWTKFRLKSRFISTQQVQPGPAASNLAVQAKPAPGVPTANIPSALPEGQPGVADASGSSQRPEITITPVAANSGGVNTPAEAVEQPRSTAPEEPSVTKTEIKPPSAPAREPLVVKSDLTRPNVSSEPVPAAPSVSEVGASTGEKALAKLVAIPAPSAKPVLRTLKVSQGVSEGLLVKKVQPRYPEQARQMRIQGPVQLEATVDKDGSISHVKVLSGEPILAHAAVTAVQQWKYRPYYLNGQPVELQTQITMIFKLP
jgi:TonB family protein